MHRFVWLSAVVALALAAGSGSAPGQTALDWELKESVFLEARHVARQEVTVLGRTKVTDTTIRFLFKFQPAKAAGVLDGTVVGCDDRSTSTGEPEE